MRERLATLISGGGTTMQAIIEACRSGEIPMDVACVIASTPTAGGMKKARDLGVSYKDIVVVEPDKFANQDAFGSELLGAMRKRGVTVVTQNGWLPLTPKSVIDEYKDKIFNQHPGPKRETRATHGVQPHAIMLYIARHTGRNNGTEVITHRVNEKWDDGSIVGSTPVPIEDINGSPETLQKRALPIEHRLQIALLQQVARGCVKEIKLQKQYIKLGEEYILFAARKFARREYPQG